MTSESLSCKAHKYILNRNLEASPWFSHYEREKELLIEAGSIMSQNTTTHYHLLQRFVFYIVSLRLSYYTIKMDDDNNVFPYEFVIIKLVQYWKRSQIEKMKKFRHYHYMASFMSRFGELSHIHSINQIFISNMLIITLTPLTGNSSLFL